MTVKKILMVFLPIIIAFQFPITVTSQEADTWIPEDVQNYCEEIGGEYGICPELIEAVDKPTQRTAHAKDSCRFPRSGTLNAWNGWA